jgi:AcrR family transcriptional regulator
MQDRSDSRFDVRAMSADSRGRKWSARQSEILDTLQALFLEEGYRHLTIGDLVDRLHCSRRTLYSLAPSKEELVLVVISRLLNKMGIEARATALAFDDPGDAIAAYLHTAITTFEPATAAFTEDLESYLPTKHLYDHHLLIALRVLRELIENGIDAGIFHPFHPALIAEILDACVERIRRPAVLERAGVSSSEAIAEFSEFIRHGLMRGSGTGGGLKRAPARSRPRQGRDLPARTAP